MNHADVVEHFKDVEDVLQETNEVHDAAIIDVDDFQRVSKYLEALGTVIVIFSYVKLFGCIFLMFSVAWDT